MGSPNVAELTINDNDTGAPVVNVIDDSTFFVRQHYLDFLNREPDPAGQAFWVNQIESCGRMLLAAKSSLIYRGILPAIDSDTGLAAYLRTGRVRPTTSGDPLRFV